MPESGTESNIHKSLAVIAVAYICRDEKVEKLAELANDGVEKMAEYMMTKGSGKYDEYSEWSGKLMQVYMDESQKITEAYMSSAMGSFGF